jgi:tetratricopeptide (TPR) repeat protein
MNALAVLGKVLELNPNDTYANYNIANYFFKQDMFETALEHYKTALSGWHPESGISLAIIHYNMGETFVQLGDHCNALLCYEEAIRNDPNEEFEKRRDEIVQKMMEKSQLSARIQSTRENRMDNPDQQRFREDVLLAYNGKCAVTGCSVVEALEAAHIYEIRDFTCEERSDMKEYVCKRLNEVCNGIALRADLHALFDRQLWSISCDTEPRVEIGSYLMRYPEYSTLNGHPITLPKKRSDLPDNLFKQHRYEKFKNCDVSTTKE